jgi:NDP-sugar pyrophosphorylase family protein
VCSSDLSIAADIPKPMIPLCGKPILARQIECLRKNNLREIIIVTGHLGNVIKEYFGSGEKFGAAISYFTEETPLGTAGALFHLAPSLSDDFILLNGDILFDIDFSRIVDFHRAKKAAATLAVHPNNHPADSALL